MKDRTTAAILSLFLGGLGVHKFYLGKAGQGILYLLFCWTFIPMVIGVIEFLVFITMTNEKFNNTYNIKSDSINNVKKFCVTCGTELTFMTSPNLGGGFLSDGERVCRNCFSQIIKIDAGFGLNSKKKYNSITIRQLLNPQPTKTITTKDVFTTSVTSTGKNQTQMTIGLNEENLLALIQQQQEKRENEIKSFNYQPFIIQRQGLQLLESVNILWNTKNIDTLKGRFEFILQMYDDFVKASYNQRYISDIQRSIDEYKRMYYDRIIQDFEIQLILKPNFDNLNLFYSKCVNNCFLKFYEDQKIQIEQLKQENAKIKRRMKIIEVANEAIFEMDKIETDDENHLVRINEIKSIIEQLEVKKSNSIAISGQNLETDLNSVVINPKSNFELTLFNTSKTVINQVVRILKDETKWNKEQDLLPLFAEHNIKCKEIEDYIKKYKTKFQIELEKFKQNSEEYNNATEMDKADIENELIEIAMNSLYERANCDLFVLFSGSEIDITVDDELIKQFGFDTISKYFRFQKDRIYIDWERKEFEDLIKAGLAIDAQNIPIDEILAQQTLKTLNKICEKDDNYFKRKNKAIEYLNENPNLKENIGKHIATRKIFKLQPLPEKFAGIDYELIKNQWNYLKEYIRVLVDTFRTSERYTEEIKGDKSWIKEFRIDIHETLNSSFVCQCAREHKNKKYPKSNPPKLPFHVGCSCHLRTEI